jgi:hypothetical protein
MKDVPGHAVEVPGAVPVAGGVDVAALAGHPEDALHGEVFGVSAAPAREETD